MSRIQLWLKSTQGLLVTNHLFFFLLELLFCRGIETILGQRQTYPINLWLERILAINLVFFHFSDHFFLFAILVVKPLNLINMNPRWVTLANDFGSQVDCGFEGAVALLAVLCCYTCSILQLLLQERSLPWLKIFQVAIEHVGMVSHPFAALWYVWLVPSTLFPIHWFTSVEKILLETVRSVSVQAFSSVLTWNISSLCIFIVLKFNNFLWFIVYFWLECEIGLLLFSSDSEPLEIVCFFSLEVSDSLMDWCLASVSVMTWRSWYQLIIFDFWSKTALFHLL